MQIGFLTRDGTLIDIDQYRTKWQVIEHEIQLADKLDQGRQQNIKLVIDHQRKLRKREMLQAQRESDIEFCRQLRKSKSAAYLEGLKRNGY